MHLMVLLLAALATARVYDGRSGSLDVEPRTARLRRTVDGFFLKLSYLFRL